MVWIYFQGMEESRKPFRDMSGPSLTVKSSDTLKESFFHECSKDKSHSPRFGMTLTPSKDQCSHPSTSFTEGSPARTFQSQDAEKVWTESEAVFFSRSQGSSAKYDPDSCSWKMFQLSLTGDPAELSENWSPSGMTVDGVFYPLQTWERTTRGQDGGCWPTPTAQDFKKLGPNSKQQGLSNKVFWRTPDVNCSRGPSSRERYLWKMENNMPISLNDQVRFSTPNASDCRDRGHLGMPAIRRRMEKGKQINLSMQVSEVSGSLNPTWVEWLMGLPSEATVLEPSVMEWFRPKRVKRSKG